MNAILIVNPVSGRTMITEYIDDILSILKKKGVSVTTLMTRRKDDAKHYAREYGENVELIVCCGGDGTLGEVVNGVVPLQNGYDQRFFQEYGTYLGYPNVDNRPQPRRCAGA